MSDTTIIRNIGLLATCDGEAHTAQTQVDLIPRAAVVLVGGKVAFLGPESQLPRAIGVAGAIECDAEGGFVGPGLVDPHTHLVFAGNRSNEFEARCQGQSYLDIAQSGGGIQKTVWSTRQATQPLLEQGALPRLKRLLSHGVTTAEIKSGYGLDIDTELKMLRVIDSLSRLQPISLLATAMPLHSLPAEFEGNRTAYFERIATPLLTEVKKQSLASAVDVFVERTAFSHQDTTNHLALARRLGFGIHLHVDQLTAGEGAALAVHEGALSASHLEQISAAGISALAASRTVAVLAPVSTLFARVKPYAPGRALTDAGARVALCTNVNPGSSLSENVSLTMSLACLENGLTPTEAYLGFTRNAGLAVGSTVFGRLRVGEAADLVIYRADSHRDLPYHLATSLVHTVFKNGIRFDF